VKESFTSVYEWALNVLKEPNPEKKVRLSIDTNTVDISLKNLSRRIPTPTRPARPKFPLLLQPRDMPRRSTGQKGRVAFVHALAHIELNAIDLAWDMILRFGPELGNTTFIIDWIKVAKDEAQHFQLLSRRLIDFGQSYGDLPAHDGLWEAAMKTSHDVLDRLAVIPMMLEARGIDTTPAAVNRIKSSNDMKTALVLEEIYHDEIEHLRIGVFWFEHICKARELDPIATWRYLVGHHLNSKPKMPLNVEGRCQAHMNPEYWENWCK